MEIVLTSIDIDTSDRKPDVSLLGVSTSKPALSLGVIQGTGIELPDLMDLSTYNELTTKKNIYYFIGG